MIRDDINTATEEWIVSALCRNPDFLSTFWERLDDTLFVSKQAKVLFKVIREEWSNSGNLSELAVARKATEFGLDAGPALGILGQCTFRETRMAFEEALTSLEDDRTVRAAKAIGEALSRSSTPDDAREAITKLQQIVAPPAVGKHTITMAESYHKVVDELHAALEGKPMSKGVQTRLPLLNSLTGGMSSGKLWLISGETSDGKSMLAMNLVRAFIDEDKPAAVYSWEMPDEDITKRVLADIAGVNLGMFTGDVKLTREDQANIMEASEWMQTNGKKCHIVNASPMNIYDVEADIRMKVLRDGVKCVCIDYLQLMDLSDLSDSREQQIANGCSRIYRLAASLGFTLIFLSQLNDDMKLRESRAPGMDADVSLMIRKVMKKDELGQLVSDENRRDVFLAKNRGGKRFVTIPCIFMGGNARFVEMDQRHHEEELKNAAQAPQKRWSKKLS